jgi:hypothetical protein
VGFHDLVNDAAKRRDDHEADDPQPDARNDLLIAYQGQQDGETGSP